MIFPFFKKMGFWVFLVHPTVVSVLLSASVERCFVSSMQDFYIITAGFVSFEMSLRQLKTYLFDETNLLN